MLNSIYLDHVKASPSLAGFHLLSAPLPVNWRDQTSGALGLHVVSTQKRRGWLHRPPGALHLACDTAGILGMTSRRGSWHQPGPWLRVPLAGWTCSARGPRRNHCLPLTLPLTLWAPE